MTDRTGWKTFEGFDGQMYSNYFLETVWVWEEGGQTAALHKHYLLTLLGQLNIVAQYVYDCEGVYEIVICHKR